MTDRPVTLTRSELVTLHDCRDWTSRNAAYYWKPKTMAKLVAKGLAVASETLPTSHRLTEAGEAYAKANPL
ncbi:MAG: hypothetical protein K2X45_07945 [Phreatobacter sp.]|nr:hypothetical protein [Phreatobacter sp.]